jgi:hypothetical protein
MENSNLADRYFYAKQRLEEAEAEVEELRSEIIQTGKVAIGGAVARVMVEASEFKRFSARAAKELLTPAQIKECTRTSSGFTVRVKPLTVVKKATGVAELFD